MKTNIDYFGQTDVEIDVDYSHIPFGYGHWRVTADVECYGIKKSFYHTTNNSEWIGKLNNVKRTESHETVQECYHGYIFDKIEEEVREWLPERVDSVKTYPTNIVVFTNLGKSTHIDIEGIENEEEMRELLEIMHSDFTEHDRDFIISKMVFV